jgi:hypothetical protein
MSLTVVVALTADEDRVAERTAAVGNVVISV